MADRCLPRGTIRAGERMTLGTQAVSDRIAAAVSRWLDSLDPAQRGRAVYPFGSTERFVWDYRPGPRGGLALADMTDPQRAAALAIVDAALSARGAAEVRAVIARETVLGELERRSSRLGDDRNPELYWFALFGEPSGPLSWSWRLGGHHVAVQLTFADGRLMGGAPSFLGANPATVPDGPQAGSRAIDGEETLARALLASLSPGQRRRAVVDPVAPPDLRTGNGRRAHLSEVPDGIAYDQLERPQRDGLERLIRHYLERADPAIAEAEWDRIQAADLAPVTFAWAGSGEPGQGHYYAVRGPRLLIEYDNTQNGANHIHSVWRDPTNDWGEDLLGEHYRQSHHAS